MGLGLGERGRSDPPRQHASFTLPPLANTNIREEATTRTTQIPNPQPTAYIIVILLSPEKSHNDHFFQSDRAYTGDLTDRGGEGMLVLVLMLMLNGSGWVVSGAGCKEGGDGEWEDGVCGWFFLEDCGWC